MNAKIKCRAEGYRAKCIRPWGVSSWSTCVKFDTCIVSRGAVAVMVVSGPMARFKTGVAFQNLVRVVLVLAMGALTAACFQPLYGNRTIGTEDSVKDRLGSIDIADIKAANGTPEARLAVAVRNALLFDLNGGQTPSSATHRLVITLSAARTTVIVDVTSGRPDAQVE